MFGLVFPFYRPVFCPRELAEIFALVLEEIIVSPPNSRFDNNVQARFLEGKENKVQPHPTRSVTHIAMFHVSASVVLDSPGFAGEAPRGRRRRADEIVLPFLTKTWQQFPPPRFNPLRPFIANSSFLIAISQNFTPPVAPVSEHWFQSQGTSFHSRPGPFFFKSGLHFCGNFTDANAS